MTLSSKFGERFTSILSTLIAAALLAAGVTAQQARTSRPVTIEQLESDLRFQISSAFRMTPLQAEQRLQELDGVLKEFRSKPRSEKHQRILAEWLMDATVRSMPGSTQPMPPAPQYSELKPDRPVTPTASRPQEPVAPPTPPPPTIPDRAGVRLAAAPVAEVRERNEFSIVREKQPQEPVPPVVSTRLQTPTQEPLPEPVRIASRPVPATQPETIIASPPATQLVSTREKPTSTPVVPETIPINLPELAARIAGYHSALDDLEAGAINTVSPSEESIARQIDALEGLIPDYQFVQLYYESLNPEERRRVAAPRRLAEPIADVRQQLRNLQKDFDVDFLGQFDRALNKRLAELRQRLDAIADDASW